MLDDDGLARRLGCGGLGRFVGGLDRLVGFDLDLVVVDHQQAGVVVGVVAGVVAGRGRAGRRGGRQAEDAVDGRVVEVVALLGRRVGRAERHRQFVEHRVGHVLGRLHRFVTFRHSGTPSR